MNWNSWSDFWNMGGYGAYVWGSYAVTFALITAEVVTLARRKRATLDQVAALAHQKATRAHETAS
jgi:heme exporter protein D